MDDYQGVLVPLENATRHPTVAAEYARRRSAEGRSGVNDDSTFGKKKTEGDVSPTDGPLSDNDQDLPRYTLEGLRAEVNEDVAASGHDSNYDLKSKVINKAIQDIGMGR